MFDQLWHGTLIPKTQADIESAMHDWLAEHNRLDLSAALIDMEKAAPASVAINQAKHGHFVAPTALRIAAPALRPM